VVLGIVFAAGEVFGSCGVVVVTSLFTVVVSVVVVPFVFVAGVTGAITFGFFRVFAGFFPTAGVRLGSFEFDIIVDLSVAVGLPVVVVDVIGLVPKILLDFAVFAAALSVFFVFETVAVFAGIPVVVFAVFAAVLAAVGLTTVFVALFSVFVGLVTNDLSVFDGAV